MLLAAVPAAFATTSWAVSASLRSWLSHTSSLIHDPRHLDPLILLRARYHAEMEEARSALETILDRGLVHSRNGTVVYESVLEREFPDIDIRLLCGIYAEKLGDPPGCG